MVRGKAIKIIDIDETGESFKLNERALARVFENVPQDMPVSLVSVVGAFRTGKSFLLDFFLKYLYASEGKRPDMEFDEEPDLGWMTKGGELLEGKVDGWLVIRVMNGVLGIISARVDVKRLLV